MPCGLIITPVPVMGESSLPFVSQRILTIACRIYVLIEAKSGVGSEGFGATGSVVDFSFVVAVVFYYNLRNRGLYETIN